MGSLDEFKDDKKEKREGKMGEKLSVNEAVSLKRGVYAVDFLWR